MAVVDVFLYILNIPLKVAGWAHSVQGAKCSFKVQHTWRRQVESKLC